MKTILLILFLGVCLTGFGQTTVSTNYTWTGSKNSFTQPLTVPNATATNKAVNLGQVNSLLAGKQNTLVNPVTKADSIWIKDLIRQNQSQQADITRLEAMIMKIQAQLADTVSLKKALIELLTK